VAAATCRDDQLRGNRQRAMATAHASAPAHSTAACASSTPRSVASRAAVHGCNEKWRRSTAAGSTLRPRTRSKKTSSPASTTPHASCMRTKKAQWVSGARRIARSATLSLTAADTSVAASAAPTAPPISSRNAVRCSATSLHGAIVKANQRIPPPAITTTRIIPVNRSSPPEALARALASSSGPASSRVVNASTAMAIAANMRRALIRSAARSADEMAASARAEPSALATTNEVVAGSAARVGSCSRSSTGARSVGMMYSLVVSSLEPARAGVRTCSTATEPIAAPCGDADAMVSR